MRTAIIGGDKRMLYAAQAFQEAGAEVILCGFDKMTNKSVDPALCAEDADMIILPVRPVDGGCIAAPYASRPIPIKEISEAIGEKPVFTGCADSVKGLLSGKVFDYAAREDFMIYNAALTAEGLLDVIGREYEGSVFRSRILILGWGRIGRIAARYLRALGAEVTAAARGSAARAWAVMDGVNAFDYSELELKSYDIIVNTVPALILDAAAIDRVSPHALIVDLASKPGGVDFDHARHRGIRTIHALGLPGRIAPLTAGRIIKDTICTIIKEENGGKDHVGLCDDGFLLHL
jgi:dipicolinate synthase subunit A